MVCIKPVGVLSQSDAAVPNMVSLLETRTGETVYPVHRLDKETGGIMVYAKSKVAAASLSRQVAAHEIIKEYLVLLHGVPANPAGQLTDLLFHDRMRNKSYVVKRPRKGVRSASLEYRILASFNDEEEIFSLLSVRLYTGRTHQIRVQFSHRGTPLAGDRKYGAHDRFSDLGLWSHRLTFSHPITQEKLYFAASPDSVLKPYWESLPAALREKGTNSLFFPA